ncbi:hypothetical protein A2160_05655 [Candidatus Beckwithbacteria bacterium RBG_13_42_9]|uniref:Uncharacterized protein n=1 Tax=Candidatus Beckwithbacteria bacterium RBG_13_42_9 TaxID=1797457 RepID=A0A1F5E635_9BACT|nr:MAG: hypothetical protein A2160_05655 [Candidatus Beckwithbacteria bacterium RBG_13_42_9]
MAEMEAILPSAGNAVETLRQNASARDSFKRLLTTSQTGLGWDEEYRCVGQPDELRDRYKAVSADERFRKKRYSALAATYLPDKASDKDRQLFVDQMKNMLAAAGMEMNPQDEASDWNTTNLHPLAQWIEKNFAKLKAATEPVPTEAIPVAQAEAAPETKVWSEAEIQEAKVIAFDRVGVALAGLLTKDQALEDLPEEVAADLRQIFKMTLDEWKSLVKQAREGGLLGEASAKLDDRVAVETAIWVALGLKKAGESNQLRSEALSELAIRAVDGGLVEQEGTGRELDWVVLEKLLEQAREWKQSAEGVDASIKKEVWKNVVLSALSLQLVNADEIRGLSDEQAIEKILALAKGWRQKAEREIDPEMAKQAKMMRELPETLRLIAAGKLTFQDAMQEDRVPRELWDAMIDIVEAAEQTGVENVNLVIKALVEGKNRDSIPEGLGEIYDELKEVFALLEEFNDGEEGQMALRKSLLARAAEFGLPDSDLEEKTLQEILDLVLAEAKKRSEAPSEEGRKQARDAMLTLASFVSAAADPREAIERHGSILEKNAARMLLDAGERALNKQLSTAIKEKDASKAPEQYRTVLGGLIADLLAAEKGREKADKRAEQLQAELDRRPAEGADVRAREEGRAVGKEEAFGVTEAVIKAIQTGDISEVPPEYHNWVELIRSRNETSGQLAEKDAEIARLQRELEQVQRKTEETDKNGELAGLRRRVAELEAARAGVEVAVADYAQEVAENNFSEADLTRLREPKYRSAEALTLLQRTMMAYHQGERMAPKLQEAIADFATCDEGMAALRLKRILEEVGSANSSLKADCNYVGDILAVGLSQALKARTLTKKQRVEFAATISSLLTERMRGEAKAVNLSEEPLF